jgi:LacI family transcriptional regulator
MTARAGPRPRAAANGGRVTIDDVAREAGVSTATVSRVLNDAPQIRAETRQRVAAVVERLNYRPSATAQSLATGRTLVIGVVVSDIKIPFFTSVAHAIQNAAMGRNYLMLLGSSDERSESEDDLVRAFAARMVDGLIVSPAVGENRLLREVVQTTPVVLVDRLVDGLNADAVLSANREGVREATAHLLGLGHKRIAYVTDRPDKTSTVERLAGYQDAMLAAGIEVDPALRWIVDYHPEPAQRAIRQFLRRHRPTALIASEGSISLGALRAAQELRLRIPEDLSLIGVDQLDWGTATTPPITVVSQDADAIGAIATRLLMRRLNAGVEPGARAALIERVPTTLVLRASCSSPARASGAEGLREVVPAGD